MARRQEAEDQVNGVNGREVADENEESLLEQLIQANAALQRIKDQNAARSRKYRKKQNEQKAKAKAEEDERRRSQ